MAHPSGANNDLPRSEYATKVRGWLDECLQEGDAFLRSQVGYDQFAGCVDAIMGEYSGAPRPSSLSDLQLNHLGKIALDLSSALTDIKPFWEYKTYNKRFDPQREMLGKLSHSWWLNRHIDLKFSDVVKYALPMGSGYAHVIYNPQIQDQDVIAEDPRDVIPIRPGSFVSIQEAFGVITRRERTVNYMRARFPQFARYIHADRDGSYRTQQQQSRASKLMSSLGLSSGFMDNLRASVGGRTQAQTLNIPTLDVFTIYISDTSRNESAQPVQMGDPDTNWGYIVQPGDPLYPRKRCIVMVRSCPEPLYDGPSIYWHGLFPVAKLTLDPWPWSWLGKAPLKDMLPLQRELDRNMRVVSDHNERVARPGLSADKNSVSRDLMNKLDTRRAGLKIRHNPIAGKGVEVLHEPPLDPSIPATIEFLIAQMKELSGSVELTQLAKLGQIPSAETVEKIMESMSPAVRVRSRVMEVFLREFATMVASNFFQFYTQKQRVAVLGPSGLTFDDFDFDPGTLVPDMREEMGVGPNGQPYPRDVRAREFLRFFTYHVAPGSLLAASQITRKLLYIQLARMGYIDSITLLEVLDVPNIGAPEEAGTTIMERLMWQQEMGMGMAVGPAGASASGRKATAQTMPKIALKDSGTRMTVKESS